MTKLSEEYNDPLPIPASLWAMLNAGAQAYPDNTHLTATFQSQGYLSQLKPATSKPSKPRYLSWTLNDVRHASILLAAGFQDRGIKRGSTILTLIPNGLECILLSWVSAILQLTYSPLDLRLLVPGREEQLREYMKRIKPDTVVVPDESATKTLDAALSDVGMKVGVKISIAETSMSGWDHLPKLASPDQDTSLHEAALAQDPQLDRNGDRIALILFTSGTSTGQPKGCLRSVNNMLAGTVGNAGCMDMPSSTIIQTSNSGVIFQAFSFICAHNGYQVVLPSVAPSVAHALDAVEMTRAKMMVCIPVSIRMIAKEQADRERDISSVERVAIGGDMCTRDAVEQFQKWFPKATVAIGHGMTEGTSLIGWGHHEIPEPYPESYNILTLGHCAPGSKLRICDEDRQILPRGQAGELHLGGPCVINQYLNNAQPESFYRDDRGSWLRTGDRALMDQEGRVFIVGRIKDIIKRIGQSLSPAVAESVLNGMDGVEVGASALHRLSVELTSYRRQWLEYRMSNMERRPWLLSGTEQRSWIQT